MNNKLGLGVLINMLSDDKPTIEAIKSSLNKKIKLVEIVDNVLKFTFEDDTNLNIWDDGKSCCESRYLIIADKLNEYVGSTLLDFEIKTAPNIPVDYGDHEIQFLDVKTDKGIFQLANHNEHNGYYGGFYLKASNN